MKTPITYYGGKQQLASQIIAMIPPHKIYCECSRNVVISSITRMRQSR